MTEEAKNQPEKVVGPAPPKDTLPPSKARSHTLVWVTLSLLVIGLAWFALWFFYFRFYESTDDAYANGNMISINSAIPGSVVAFYADDTELVNEGQVLVLLDITNYEIIYQKELATLATVVLQVRQMYDNVSASRANVEIRRIELEKAQYDYENRLQLVKPKAVSNEEFIHAQDNLRSAKQNLKYAEEQFKVAQDAAGNTPIESHPLIEQQKAKVREAYYNLHHTVIYAPATGYVAQRAVDVGQWVEPTTDLMAIIPTDYVWVDANFKETQLEKMRIGQPAKVWFDLYGSKVVYEGKVLGIASGSGSVFSLIPPQNATGNWIKIVQRLPVRISLDNETLRKYPSRLGISAEVDVDITNQDLPMLAQIPSTKPISLTRVFDIDLDQVNQVMNEVVKENLKRTEPGVDER